MSAVWFAIGTLSLLPVPAAAHPSARTRALAMLLAPLVGVLLGLLTAAVVIAVSKASDAPELLAVVALAVTAGLTRGLHLDGLADVADGLGSRRPPAEARAVMRRSDVGAFGVVAVVITLLCQFAALTVLLGNTEVSWVLFALGSAALLSRTQLTLSCRRGVRAADDDGLGASVAETVPPAATLLVLVGVMAAILAAASVVDQVSALRVLACALASVVVAELWRWHCTRRLGGLSGDVLGSVEQVTWTSYVFLLALAL